MDPAMMVPDATVVTSLVFLIIVILSVYFYLTGTESSGKQDGNLPPGPKPWPVIGNLGNLVALDLPTHQAFAKLSKQYGPLMFMRFGSKPVIVASSPKMARQVVKIHDEVFSSRPQSTPNMEILYSCQSIGSSVYGRRWRDARKLFTLELLSSKRIHQFQRVRREETKSFVQSLLQKSSGRNPVRIDLELGKYLTRNIVRMMVNDRSFSGRSLFSGMAQILKIMTSGEVQENIKQLLRLLGVLHLGDYIPFFKIFDVQGHRRKMRAEHGKMDNVLEGLIADHRGRVTEQPEASNASTVAETGPDFVDALLARPNGQSHPMDEARIKGSLQEAILVGTDMITNTVDWAFSELLRNPRVIAKAHEELDSVVGRERLVEEEDIPNLPYLQAIVKEAFRLHPVMPLLIPRESTQACVLAGYHIPARCEVFVNVWAIGRDEATWGAHALNFVPERFLPDPDSYLPGLEHMDVKGEHYELLPFGSGRRGCPGMNLGILQVQYVVAIMLQTGDWNLPVGKWPGSVDMSELFSASVSRGVPLEVIVNPRLPNHVLFPPSL